MKNKLKVEIYQQDWIPGFAAFRDDGSIEEGTAHIGLNVGALMASVMSDDISPADLPYVISDLIMHEIIHVLEAWAKVEFNEKRVQALIENYRQHYNKKS